MQREKIIKIIIFDNEMKKKVWKKLGYEMATTLRLYGWDYWTRIVFGSGSLTFWVDWFKTFNLES